MTTIIVNAFDFQALQMFIAKKDVRNYLNGFHVGKHHLTATDGKVLLRIAHNCQVDDNFPDDGYILDAVKVATKRAPNGEDAMVTLQLDRIEAPCNVIDGAVAVTDKLELTANNSTATVRLEALAGTYPDVERVIPNRDTAKPVANYFDPKFLELAGKAAQLLCKSVGASDGMVTTLGEPKQATLFKIPQRSDVDMVVMPMNPREWGEV
jgi:hypothetical protein